MCVPGWNSDWLEEFEFELIPETEPIVRVVPDEVRRPIPEFNEVLGAIVMRRSSYRDGTTIVHEYEEATVEKLVSVTASLPSGESMKVDLRRTTDQPVDLVAIEAALLNLLRQGFQPSAIG